MQRKPKTYSRKTTALTDAKPEFVSIVRTGANMIPFRAMKSEDNPESTMQLKTKSETHDIARLVFKGDAFKEEAAVTAWLAAGGYEGMTVVKEEDGSFSVTDPEAPTEGLVEIETDGVTAFIFKKAEATAKEAATAAEAPTPESLPSTVTKTEPVQPVATAKTDDVPPNPAADAAVEGADKPVVVIDASASVALKTELLEALRVKFDEWEVAYSDELSLSGALADGFDGVPPGFGEVMTALYSVTRNACITGDSAGLAAAFADAATVVQKLAAIFPTDVPLVLDTTIVTLAEDYMVEKDGEKVIDEARVRAELFFPEMSFAASPLMLSAAKADDTEVEARKADMSHKRKRIQAKAASKPQAETTTKTEQPNTTEKAEAAPEVTGDALTAALSAALAPALSAITTLTETIKSERAAHADQLTKVKAEATEAIEAVRTAAVERQTRKAADADEHQQGNTVDPKTEKQKQATKSVAEMRLRGALGMPRVNR